jgi:hypothetical protein
MLQHKQMLLYLKLFQMLQMVNMETPSVGIITLLHTLLLNPKNSLVLKRLHLHTGQLEKRLLLQGPHLLSLPLKKK